MSEDLKNWQPRPRPERKVLEGRYVRLEPLDAARHGDGLFEASSVTDADGRFRWLFEVPPESRAAFQPWLDKVEASSDPLFFAVIDKASGKVAGRQTLMRIEPAFGVIEIGNIYWGPQAGGDRGTVPVRPICFRRARLPPLRVEVQQQQRTVKAGGGTLRLQFRGYFPPASGGQEREPRYGVVLDHRQGMAGAEEGLRSLAGPGQFRRRRAAEAASGGVPITLTAAEPNLNDSVRKAWSIGRAGDF